MNYKDIYNSYLEDIKKIEEKYNLTPEGIKILKDIKTKTDNLKQKNNEMGFLEISREKLDYYTTGDYMINFRNIRKKIIRKYGEIIEAANEIEKLLFNIEKEKNRN